MKYELIEKCYQIKDYEQIVQKVMDFVEASAKYEIKDDEDKKEVKKSRTLIRKMKQELADYRKNLVASVVGKYQDQSKVLENILDEADKKMKSALDAYEGNEPQGKKYEITIQALDMETISAIKDFAERQKNVLSYKIKE